MPSSSTILRVLLGVTVVANSACSNGGGALPTDSAGGHAPTAGAASDPRGGSPSSGGTGQSGSSTAGGYGGQLGGGSSLGGSTATGSSGGSTGSAGTAASGGQAAGGASGGGAATSGSAGSNVGGGGASSGGTAGRPSSGGNSASGSAGAAQGGAAGTGPFVLSWQDDFNTLNAANWRLQNFTFDGNQAQFSPQNATVANGVLSMALTPAPAGSAKPYLGVEMRSTQTLTYGKLSARMRFATGSGVVSGLVLFYTPFPNCDWNEIDIEHLGNSANTSQFNAMVYTGSPVPNCTTSVTPTQEPLIANLGFNAESDFHLYDVEWTPAGIRYFADGVLLRTWTTNIARMRLPQTILLTIWASNVASWAGALTPNSAPTTADVDWIKVYSWNG